MPKGVLCKGLLDAGQATKWQVSSTIETCFDDCKREFERVWRKLTFAAMHGAMDGKIRNILLMDKAVHLLV